MYLYNILKNWRELIDINRPLAVLRNDSGMKERFTLFRYLERYRKNKKQNSLPEMQKDYKIIVIPKTD
ncbi:MAG: hypothetical protein LBD73_02285 [Deferribacteraceae bacterium]|jgi:hypothetical protein|nr:hypothetical protein [Deferribacteraceae bacterium]